MFKKMVAAALALALVASCTVRASATEAEKKAPKFSGGIVLQNLDYYGTQTCRITGTTTAKLCASGEGIVDEVCPHGGTLGAYTLTTDSDVAGTRSVTNSDSLIIVGPVYTKTDSTSSPTGPCFKPEKPRFILGLVAVQSSAGHSTEIHWHRTSGVNP
jgi:hypothetical protein